MIYIYTSMTRNAIVVYRNPSVFRKIKSVVFISYNYRSILLSTNFICLYLLEKKARLYIHSIDLLKIHISFLCLWFSSHIQLSVKNLFVKSNTSHIQLLVKHLLVNGQNTSRIHLSFKQELC